MCGICGIVNNDGRPVDRSAIEEMCRRIAHRGPDGQGIHVSGHVGLGHRRLSVIDLATGDQPMSDENDMACLVFNGEIYNFKEIRHELVQKGHRFFSQSDTEVLLKSYLEWGEDAVLRFRGMFAFALWDRRRQKLVLARDRVGKKPLYYHVKGDTLAFASEMKALLSLPGMSRQMDLKGLDAYLSFGYVPSPRTIFKQIKKLEPAQIAVFSKSGITIRSYWDLDMSPRKTGASPKRLVEDLRALFDEAVSLRLVSDVPLGAFLSGGVDSSAVVAAMTLMSRGEPVKTSAVGFEDRNFSELEYAEQVARHCQTDHTQTIVTPSALEILDRIVWHFDEPFADSSAIPTWYVSKMTRQKVTVALSGDGGDENFAGYTQRYTMNRFEQRIRHRLPAWFQDPVLSGLAALYPQVHRLPRPLRLKGFLTNLSLGPAQAYFRDMSFYFKPEEKERLYTGEMKRFLAGSSPFDVIKPHLAANAEVDTVARAQYLDIKTYMPEDILVKVDRMSMAHSLEVRSPILDHRLMEFAAAIPSDCKLNGRESKYIFKKMNAGRLPADILHRPKQGFCVPLARWLRQDLSPLVEATLFQEKNDLGRLINMDWVGKLWQAHKQGISDHSHKIWGLLMLFLWFRQFGQEGSHVS